MPKQRQLKLESFDDLLTELSTIENQYRNQTVTTTGNWSFYQILDHLTTSIVASVQGYPKMMPKAIRRTLGPKALKHILKTGKMKAGAKNPDAPQKREDGDEHKALSNLRQSIKVFRSHKGDYAEHSFFGPINKEDYEKMHSIHAALHLSFVQLDENLTIKENPKIAAKTDSKASKKTTEKVAKKSAKKASRKTVKKAAKKNKTS